MWEKPTLTGDYYLQDIKNLKLNTQIINTYMSKWIIQLSKEKLFRWPLNTWVNVHYLQLSRNANQNSIKISSFLGQSGSHWEDKSQASCSKDTRGVEPALTTAGNVNQCIHYGNHYERDLIKTEKELSSDLAILLLDRYSKDCGYSTPMFMEALCTVL